MGFHHYINGTGNGGECDEPESLEYYHWINFVFISIVACIGLMSQFVVITVLGLIKKKTSTDIFLISLSVLDIFVIICLSVTENGSIYLHILNPGQQMLNAGYISVVAHPFEHIAHFASTWCIVLMSLDRYISICHTNHARFWCTVRKAKMQIAVLMVIVTIYSIPRFLEYYPIFGMLDQLIAKCDAEVHDFPEGYLGDNDMYIWLYTFGTYLLIMYIIPLTMLCFFNYHLIRMIRDRINFHKRRNNQISPTSAKKKPAMNVPPEASSSDMQDEAPHTYTTIPKLLTVNEFTSKSETQIKTATPDDDLPLTPDAIPDTKLIHKDLPSDEAISAGTVLNFSKNGNNNITNYKQHIRAVTTLSTGASKKMATSIGNLTAEKSRNKYIQRQYDHVIRMLITVTLVFSICQIPDMVQQLISRVSGWDFSDEFGIIAYDFIIINSSINLFIYTATSQRFKKKLTKTFKCLRRKDRVSPLQGMSSIDNT